MGGCCPNNDDDPDAFSRRVGLLLAYVVFGLSVFVLTTWLLPKIDEARRRSVPRIRVSPPQEHESHPQTRADLDRG